MRKIIALGTAAILALTLCACQDSTSPNTAATTTAAQNTEAPATTAAADNGDTEAAETTTASESGGDVSIGVSVQEYEGDNIIEILKLDYEGDNPEAQKFNDAVDNGIFQECLATMEAQDEDSHLWTEIKSYPIMSDDYLQIAVHSIIYPTYGTFGNIESFNYSIKENRYITLEEALSNDGLTNDSINEKAKEFFVPEYPSETLIDAAATGFLYFTEGTAFLLQANLDNPDGTPRSAAFVYVPSTESLFEMETEDLIEMEGLVEMDPPLSYARAVEVNNGVEIAESVFYQDLMLLEADPGDGVSPEEGAEIVYSELLEPEGFMDSIDTSSQCVYIVFDDLVLVASEDGGDGNECYLYSIAIGNPESGFMGEDYEVIQRVGVDYGTGTVTPLEE